MTYRINGSLDIKQHSICSSLRERSALHSKLYTLLCSYSLENMSMLNTIWYPV